MRGSSRGLLALAALALAWVAVLLVLPPRPSWWSVMASGLPLLLATSWFAAQRAGDTWIGHVRSTPDLHALALVLLYGLGVQCADSHGVSTDGAIYFSQLRSAIFDRDLDVAREFAFLGQPPRPSHFVPIGPTLLWLPLYVAVTLVDGIGRTLGAWRAPAGDPVALGLGLSYVRAALLSSYAIGAAGLWAVHARLRREFLPGIAFTATLLLFGATTLFWYMVYEPTMTHAASFGMVALFVVAADAWLPDRLTPRRGIALGALAALAFLMRPQEALFVLFAVALIIAGHASWPARLHHGLRLLGWAAIGAAPFLVLQAIHGVVLYSQNDFRLTGEQGYLDLLHSRWVDTLFSSWHGLFSWTPIVSVAALGTVGYWRRRAPWAASALGLLFLMAWVNGSTVDWNAGWSFGGRRFTSMLPLLAPGLALVIEAAVARPLLALTPLVAAALLWNYLLMVQFTGGLLPKDEPVSFARMVRQQAELHTRSPYFYPFAFPANAWFAWREGLPIDRYDLLAPEPVRTSVDIALDGNGQKFLLDGWDAPGGDEWGSYWWMGRDPAVIAVPFDPPDGRAVAVEITTRARYEEPVVDAECALEINGIVVGRFNAVSTRATSARVVVPAVAGRRVWRRGYNRVAIRSLGVARVDPADTRSPGEIASRLGSHPWPVAVYRVRITPE